MKKIRTIILDDDAASRFAAASELSNYGEIEIVAQLEDSKQLFEFLQKNSAQLLILDIELNDELGFEIAGRLMKEQPNLMIVFLTGHSSYAIDGYDFKPVNFLTKPINPAKLSQTIEEVKRRLENVSVQESAKLMFHTSKGHRILDVRDICFIERLHRKNILHTEEEALTISGYTMHDLEQMLSLHGFFMCHQSFIISLYRVTAVRDAGRQLYEAVLKGVSEAVPVSRHRYEELMKSLSDIGVKPF